MPKQIAQLIATTEHVLAQLEAPLTEGDRECHWREEAQIGWVEYVGRVREFLVGLQRNRAKWTSEAATEIRAWHIAHGLDSDGLHSGERVDALIGLQRTLVGGFREV